MQRYIEITSNFVGFHKYPTASSDHSKFIDYLESTHRHIFYIYVILSVEHHDRELEFHMVQNRLKEICNVIAMKDMASHQKSNWSCEKIAEVIKEELNKKIPATIGRYTNIKVSEDNENSAIVIWGKED